MPGAASIQGNVLDPVDDIVRRRYLVPEAVRAPGNQSDGPNRQRCPCYQLRIDPRPLAARIAINVETEIVDLISRLPLQQHITVLVTRCVGLIEPGECRRVGTVSRVRRAKREVVCVVVCFGKPVHEPAYRLIVIPGVRRVRVSLRAVCGVTVANEVDDAGRERAASATSQRGRRIHQGYFAVI